MVSAVCVPSVQAAFPTAAASVAVDLQSADR